MLAAADFSSSLFWAVLIAWILSVTLHEFSHGLVAFWGGDHTIGERGGLSFNPLQYLNPLTSFILPAIFVMMGGVPLMGGATHIRRDLLRSRGWESAMSAAGPAVNFILFVICALAIDPRMGWVDPNARVADWTNAQTFLGAFAFLQLLAVVLNLLPVPGFDGFGILSPYMNQEFVEQVTRPPTNLIILVLFFALMLGTNVVWMFLMQQMVWVCGLFGFDGSAMYAAFVKAMYSKVW